MTDLLGAKARTVLLIASMEVGDPRRSDVFNAACIAYSEKAVLKKFEDLADKGYIEYGVTASRGWLTDAGRAALAADDAARTLGSGV